MRYKRKKVASVTSKKPSKFVGKCCEICLLRYKDGFRFVEHHLDYQNNITAVFCYKCHALAHGSAKVWQHPFVKIYGKDKAVKAFAYKYLQLCEDKHA
jgi:hypothetical protein